MNDVPGDDIWNDDASEGVEVPQGSLFEQRRYHDSLEARMAGFDKKGTVFLDGLLLEED